MNNVEKLIAYIVENQEVLKYTDFIREIWMIPDRLIANARETADRYLLQMNSEIYRGKLFVHNGLFYGVDTFERVYSDSSEGRVYLVSYLETGIRYDPEEKDPLCSPQSKFMLSEGQIANFKNPSPVLTSIGKFIANYLFLVYPFGDKIPYINEEFSSSSLENKIAQLILSGEVSVRDVKYKYGNSISLFGQSNDILCPGISEKTISIPPHIHELRKKLVEEHREALEAGDASVMADIEKALIDAYKDHLKGDPSLHFLLKKKYFDVTLKKLFLTQGITEVFGSPGKFKYIEQPMGRGWQIKDLPTIFNEVRQGSYARAIETADGGVIAKLILRVLQDTRIGIDDCGTTKGELIYGSMSQLKDFEWNYLIEADGTNVLLTKDILGNYVGKTVMIRTPGYCKAPSGFCAKCFGHIFERIGQKAFAPLANDFAKVQTTNALKSMHGKSHSAVDVSEISRFLI